MEIKCSQCGFTSDGPDSLAGKKLKCPKCGVEFVASGESAFAVVEDNPAASQYKKAKEEAEEKCKMLKDAKSEYERIACI